MDGFDACKALTYSGKAAATSNGEFFPNHSPSFCCFSSVSGGYLWHFVLVACGRTERGRIGGRQKEILPFYRAGIPVEPVGHENFVLLFVTARGQDIGTLDGLVEITENIKHGDEAL
jgi:hypothetical protein